MGKRGYSEDEARQICADPESSAELLADVVKARPEFAESASQNPSWVTPGDSEATDSAAADAVTESVAESRAVPPPPPSGSVSGASQASPQTSLPPTPVPSPAAPVPVWTAVASEGTQPTPPPPPSASVPPPPPATSTATLPPAVGQFLHLLSNSWQGLAAVVGISFGVGIVGSMLTAFLANVATDASGMLSSVGASSFGTFMAVSIQLLEMANGGILVVNTTMFSGSTSGSVSIIFTPWLITILIGAAPWISSRFFGPKELSRPTRAAWSVVVGLGYSVIVTVLGAVVPLSHSPITISATGFASFFGALLLVAGGTFLGLSTITRADLHRPWTAAYASVVTFMLVAGAVVVVVFVVYSLIKQPKTVAYLPLLGPTIAWWGTVIGGAGTVGIDGAAAGSLGSYLPVSDLASSLWSGHLPAWAWSSVVVFLALVVGSGILAGVLSRPDQRTWYRIPVAWTSVALVLQLAVVIRVWVGGAASGVSASVNETVGAAAYTFLIFGLWSGIAAASAQYLSSYGVAYLPGFLRQPAVVPPPPPPPVAYGVDGMGAESEAPAPGTEPTAVIPYAESISAPAFVPSTAAQPAYSGAAPAAPAAPAAAQPAPAKLSPKAKTGLFIGLGALALVIVAAVAIGIVKSTVFSPEAKALAFMSALEQGHAQDAASALGADSSPLFSDDIYTAAENRPAKAAVSSAAVVGNTATVTISYSRSGEARTADLMLNRTGTDWLVMDRWVIVDGAPGMTSMDISWPSAAGPRSFAVNGFDLPAPPADADGAMHYLAFPGTYTVVAKADVNFKAENKTWDTDSSDSVSFGADPTDSLKNSLIGAVRTRIAECAKSTDAVPANCPFSVASSWSSSSYSNVSYRIGTIPDLQVRLSDYGGGWNVTSDTYGVVYKSYTYTGYFDSYPTKDESGSYYVSAKVSIENGTPSVTFP